MPSDVHRENHTDIYPWYVVAVLMLALMVAYVDRHLLSLLVEPIKRDLGITDTQVGLLAGFAFALFYTILGVPIAWLADRMNRSTIISVGVLLWSLMTACCGLARTYPVLFLARVGVGVGEASLSPAAYSIMADYFPPNKLARAIGIYTTGVFLGAGLAMIGGSFIVGYAMEKESIELPVIGTLFSWQLAFLIAALPGFVIFAILRTVKEPRRKNYNAAGSSVDAVITTTTWHNVLVFLGQRRRFFSSICAGGACLGAVITAYLVWVPEFMRRTFQWNIAEAGFAFGLVVVIFGTLGPYAGGWFASWLTNRGYRDAEMRSVMLGSIAILPLSILVPLTPNGTVAIILLCPLMFFLAFPMGVVPAALQLVAPSHMRAKTTAVYMLLASMPGYTVGGVLVAIVTDYIFKDENALNYALAIVSGLLVPMGILFFAYGMKPFAEARPT